MANKIVCDHCGLAADFVLCLSQISFPRDFRGHDGVEAEICADHTSEVMPRLFQRLFELRARADGILDGMKFVENLDKRPVTFTLKED